MELRPLGATGLTVSAVGFGCGAIGGLMVKGEPAAQRRAIERAIAAGIRYFDTARSYGDGQSEENLGRVLDEIRPGPEIVVGTKFRLDPPDTGDIAGAIRRSLEGSLRRLRLDRVNLLQLHNRIVSGGYGGDGALTVEQVLGPVADGLDSLRAAGLLEHIGITANGDTGAVRRVIQSGRIETAQIYFNALNPSAGYPGRVSPGGQDFGGLIDDAARAGVGVIVIRPFAAGALSAQTERHANAGNPGSPIVPGANYQDDVARAQAVADLSGELGVESPLEAALRFALAKDGVSTVLAGLSDESQLEDAIRWGERGPLDARGIERILALRD